MDFAKLTNDEIRAFDLKKLRETGAAVSKELVKLRMDVYNAGPKSLDTSKKLRRTLARLLTATNAKRTQKTGK